MAGPKYGDYEHGLLYELAARAGLVSREEADEAAPPPAAPDEAPEKE